MDRKTIVYDKEPEFDSQSYDLTRIPVLSATRKAMTECT